MTHTDQSVLEERHPYLIRLFGFHFMKPLLRLAKERMLSPEDMPLLSKDLRAEHTAPRLRADWARQTQTKGLRATLFSSFWKAEKARFLFGGFVKLLNDIALFVAPVFMAEFLDELEDPNASRQTLFILGAIMAGSILVKTFLNHWYLYIMTRVVCRSRSAVRSVLYERITSLTVTSRQSATSAGNLANLAFTDAHKATFTLQILHLLWSSPLQVVIGVFLIAQQLGWEATVASVLAMVVMMPIQSRISKKMYLMSKRRMMAADVTSSSVSEAVGAIRVVKASGFEPEFGTIISSKRSEELEHTSRFMKARLAITYLMTATPAVVSVAMFGSFALFSDDGLTAAKAFTALALVNSIRFPLRAFPQVITSVLDGRVAARRLEAVLRLCQGQPSEAPEHAAPGTISVQEAGFDWISQLKAEKLRNATSMQFLSAAGNSKRQKEAQRALELAISGEVDEEEDSDSGFAGVHSFSMEVAPGERVAIMGPIGSGKTTLLHGLLGELAPSEGAAFVAGSVAYVGQSPWVANDTLRNNILFGRDLDEERYLRVLEACALLQDLAIVPDDTEIGERGTNLSGGQRARLALARAVYAGADVYLCDDPLSAVDADVARRIFTLVFGPHGLLAQRTVLLVTQSPSVGAQFDKVLLIDKDGNVAAYGTPEAVANASAFETVMGASAASEFKQVLTGGASGACTPVTCAALDELRGSEGLRSFSPENVVLETSRARKTVEKEHRETGKISGKTWISYFKLGGGIRAMVIILFTMVLSQGAVVASDLWLAHWTKSTDDTNRNVIIYFTIILGFLLFSLFSLAYFMHFGLLAARRTHSGMLRSLLHAPLSFFEANPTGRILSRFSKDVQDIDVELPASFSQFLNTFVVLLGVVVAIVLVQWQIVFALVPLYFIFRHTTNVYRTAALELKRCDSLSKSPILALHGETLNGLVTIRAFGRTEAFQRRNRDLVNVHLRAEWHNILLSRWLCWRLDAEAALINLVVIGVVIYLREDVEVALAALSLSYVLKLSDALMSSQRQFAMAEQSLNAVERVHEYIEDLPAEKSWRTVDVEGASDSHPALVRKAKMTQREIVKLMVTEDGLGEGAARAAAALDVTEWPPMGAISFRNVRATYREDLDDVLKDVSFDILPGMKVGVVGRTGSGKSSTANVVLRLIEAHHGIVEIDDSDTKTVGLHDLRRRVVSVPQEPLLFSGPLRRSVDPVGLASDEEITNIVGLCGLSKTVSELEGGLDYELTEGGSNLSAGQRQLVCLARAVLRHSKILVLDEATANLDQASDEMVQQAVRSAFSACTIFTIAHRLNTIIDYDAILVLDGGRVAEFGTPAELIKAGGIFSELVDATGPEGAAQLKRVAGV